MLLLILIKGVICCKSTDHSPLTQLSTYLQRQTSLYMSAVYFPVVKGDKYHSIPRDFGGPQMLQKQSQHEMNDKYCATRPAKPGLNILRLGIPNLQTLSTFCS